MHGARRPVADFTERRASSGARGEKLFLAGLLVSNVQEKEASEQQDQCFCLYSLKLTVLIA